MPPNFSPAGTSTQVDKQEESMNQLIRSFEKCRDPFLELLADTEHFDEHQAAKTITILDCPATGWASENHPVQLKVAMSKCHQRKLAMNIWAECVVEGGKTIGRVRGVMVAREQGNFHQEMDNRTGQCGGCRQLAYSLFTHRGEVQAGWISSPPLQASGIWDSRLNQGHLIVIESADIDSDFAHRNPGLEESMVRGLLTELAGRLHAKFAFLDPNHVGFGDEAPRGSGGEFAYTDGERLDQARSVAFWRAMGFRRVGTSDWFCCALDEHDPSHALAAEDDFDPIVFHGPTQVAPGLCARLPMGLRNENWGEPINLFEGFVYPPCSE